jgi:hypothetical protein
MYLLCQSAVSITILYRGVAVLLPTPSPNTEAVSSALLYTEPASIGISHFILSSAEPVGKKFAIILYILLHGAADGRLFYNKTLSHSFRDFEKVLQKENEIFQKHAETSCSPHAITCD